MWIGNDLGASEHIFHQWKIFNENLTGNKLNGSIEAH